MLPTGRVGWHCRVMSSSSSSSAGVCHSSPGGISGALSCLHLRLWPCCTCGSSGVNGLAAAAPAVPRVFAIYGVNSPTEVGAAYRYRNFYRKLHSVNTGLVLDTEASLQQSSGYTIQKGVIKETPATKQVCSTAARAHYVSFLSGRLVYLSAQLDPFLDWLLRTVLFVVPKLCFVSPESGRQRGGRCHQRRRHRALRITASLHVLGKCGRRRQVRRSSLMCFVWIRPPPPPPLPYLVDGHAVVCFTAHQLGALSFELILNFSGR